MAHSAGDPKRLAFLLPDMRGGGAERVALRLIDDALRSGFPVDLVLMSAAGELMSLVPAQVRIFDLGATRVRSALLPLVRYLRAERPRGMQISMWPLTVIGILARMLARSSTRIVTSDHAALSEQYGHSRAKLWLLKLSARLFYPLADARIMVSHQAADDLAALSGLDRADLEVVYNPVSAPPAEVAPNARIEELWGASRGRIITVGTLKEQKNHALLLRAFAALRRRREAKLMILGDGPLRAQLEMLAAEEGVADDVIFAGFELDPWPYYAAAELFALSSDYEGYPLVLIEALRSGLTVVSTDCPSGPREILDQGRYGLLVPCGDADALAEAMEQALAAPRDQARARARAEQLSGQATADRYFELMLGPG